MILAIFAWLMQLSVFITPILQEHPELGFGVCEELTVVIDQQMSPHTMHSDHSSNHQMHMNAHDQKKPIHSADANCKFCLVLGHTFDPILLACLIALLVILLSKPAPVFFRHIFKLHQKLRFFLFQNRAPPQTAVFTPCAVI